MKSLHLVWTRLSLLFMLGLATLACTWSLIDFGFSDVATPAPSGNPTPVPLAEVTFTALLPAPLAPGETLVLGVLDEVTGLGLNPTLYPMTQVDAQRYTLQLPLVLNSLVKYRYYRKGTGMALEDTSAGNVVRYRLYHVTGPGGTEDRIASWSDTPFSGPTGSLSGSVIEASTGRPVVNMLVTAGGMSTFTDSLGQFVLNGLPVGTHTLTACAPDGLHTTFQQGAAVAAGLTTNAPISVQAVPTVRVTFIVNTPADTVRGAPVRLAGNLLQLGNTFADLSGGVSTVATRMPTLSPLDNTRQSITLNLPVGADVRYKYTLGDGFWNAEHGEDGRFVVRQLIVPNGDVTVTDTIQTWASGNSAPILFEVTVPANTPPGENISIQFNPFGWMEPFPMWPLGGNRWVYKLYSPLNMVGSFHYRYCRNDQCGSADDAFTAGAQANSRVVSTSITGQDIKDSVGAWAWWPEAEPGTIIAVPVNPRKGGFWAGVEFSPNYHPSWQALLPAAMQSAQSLGANTLVLTPTWTVVSLDPLSFAPTPGLDPLWGDVVQAVQYGRAQNMSVALYAVPRLSPSTPDFWFRAPRTSAWWETWFSRYRAFALYHADLAQQAGAQSLILGGEAVMPALPDGLLPNGAPSGAPADADARWRSLLNEVRQRFRGQLLWAHPYRDALVPAPAFVGQTDAIYLLWSAPLTARAGATTDTMTQAALARLDNEVLPFLNAAGKGVVLALDYPSAVGAAWGCVSAGGSGCLDWAALARPYPDTPSALLDLKGQADLYQAMLQAVNQRDWVGGLVTRGYYPPAPLRDKSSSVRGKPAADLLWYWFPRLTGTVR
ncbi:MAG: carboxypeptidase regulatory-like domain-containing protein [Anaerolineales bacterium]|nr:carboxypeptidase regulatory-like domain-containing protein [Anaerolineales bacterium]